MNASQIAEVSGNGLPRKARKTQRSCGECGSFRKRSPSSSKFFPDCNHIAIDGAGRRRYLSRITDAVTTKPTNKRNDEMSKFEVGNKYACRSVCDHNCVWTFEVVSRTAKTIKTSCGKTLRLHAKLTDYNKCETVLPLGNYSMCPILTADKLVTA